MRGDGVYDDVTEEIEVKVTYSYSRGCKGARDSLCGVRGAGPALEPDEPASVEIVSVLDKDGNEYELTPREQERIREACMEHQADLRDDAMEDRNKE